MRVYDRFAAPRPIGSGLILQPVGLAVLDRLGLAADAEAFGARITRLKGHEARTGRRILDVTYGAGRYGLAIHRASLFHLLWHAASGAGATIVPSSSITASELYARGRSLASESGEVGRFDLVIDAMGARSTHSPIKARPLPFGAVWGTVPWVAGLPADQLSQRYARADRMAGVLPIGRMPDDEKPMTAIFWSLPRAALETWPAVDFAAWKAEVAAFWPDMAPFLATLADSAEMTVATYTHGTLRRPIAERLAIIGDAAHRTSPQLGQGANMALLDAFALSLALRTAPVDEALEAYVRMRRWHVRLYQLLSAAFTPQYQSASRVLPVLRDHLLAPLSMAWPVPRILSRLVAGDLILPLAGHRFP